MSRIACTIEGCGRGIGHAAALNRWGYIPHEYICQAHWSLLTKKERRVWNRFIRHERKFGGQPRPAAAARIWQAIKRRVA